MTTMPDYDYQNLSPTEFEDLTQGLLQKQLDIIFESFTTGRDNGIDLRYSQSFANDIIVQCKRYKDYNSLFNNLKKEVANVTKINPSRYIVVTSVGLTPARKKIIFKLFTPYIKNTADIYGKNDLNNLL